MSSLHSDLLSLAYDSWAHNKFYGPICCQLDNIVDDKMNLYVVDVTKLFDPKRINTPVLVWFGPLYVDDSTYKLCIVYHNDKYILTRYLFIKHTDLSEATSGHETPLADHKTLEIIDHDITTNIMHAIQAQKIW